MASIHSAIRNFLRLPSARPLKVNAPKFRFELMGEYYFGGRDEYRLPFSECFVFVSDGREIGWLYYGEQEEEYAKILATPFIGEAMYKPHTCALFRDGRIALVQHKTETPADSLELDAIMGPLLKFLDVLAEPSAKLINSDVPCRVASKRESKGKAPLVSYRTLVIDKSEMVATERELGGTHASPRLHLRRGHIRHWHGREIWIKPTVVGDKSRGLVVKDYEVAAASH